jgi:hypothetical protein
MATSRFSGYKDLRERGFKANIALLIVKTNAGGKEVKTVKECLPSWKPFRTFPVH